ncbi:MAG: class I SAM-dependent methyltransferase, partial [Solirubrobacteraceae bacterium]
LQLAFERRALDAALDLAGPAPADRVLDLATGTGALLRRLAARPEPPREVLGVDASAGMLARVSGLPRGWRVRQADARRLPCAPGRFDLVTAAYLLHLLDPPARRAVVREAGRVLGPGGRLVVVTVIESPAAACGPVFAALAAWARRSSGIVAGLRPLDPRPALGAAGFEVLGARRTTRGYPSLSVLARPKGGL